MIRIVLAEDQKLLRGALATLLSLEDDIEVVGQAENGEEVMSMIQQYEPDVAVLDIEMPLKTGLDIAELVQKNKLACRVINSELSLAVWDDPCPLSPREREVMKLAAQGLVLQDIGAKLFLSYGTVRNYMSEAIGKLGANTRIEAIDIARSKGWLD